MKDSSARLVRPDVPRAASPANRVRSIGKIVTSLATLLERCRDKSQAAAVTTGILCSNGASHVIVNASLPKCRTNSE